jgi:hypothetical protein
MMGRGSWTIGSLASCTPVIRTRFQEPLPIGST